jgi:hypothetical protein
VHCEIFGHWPQIPPLKTMPKNPTMPYTQCITSHTAHIVFLIWWALWRRNCANGYSRVATSSSNMRACHARERTNINRLRNLDTCLVRPFKAFLTYTSFVSESIQVYLSLYGGHYEEGIARTCIQRWQQPGFRRLWSSTS